MARATDRIKELAEAPLGRLLFRYSWPALVSMSLNALYAVVDRFYIGQGCGADAMAALTLAMPVMMAFGAFGVFIGAGHSAVLSIRLGAGDRIAAEKVLGQLVAFKLLFFLVLPLVVYFNLDTILGWCGGAKVTSEAYRSAVAYLKLVLFFHVFSHLAFGLSAMMRSEGAAVQSMTCLAVGFVLNCLLDPLFIFGFKMGVAGAAWATNLAMTASCAWALAFYLRHKSVVRLRVRRIRFYPAFVMRAAGIGLAPFLQHFANAFINFALVAAFTKWATDGNSATMQVASLGIFQSVTIVVLMPIFGAQQGLAPIIGYNWGARNFDRVRRTFVLGFLVTSAICIVACVVQTVPPLPQVLVSCFVPATNMALRRLAASDLQLANCMIWCIGLNVVATTYFQAIGHPRSAIVLSGLRQIGCLLPCLWFLPYFFSDHNFGIWVSMPVSDVLAAVATIVPFCLHVRFLSRAARRFDLKTKKERTEG